MMRSAVSLIDRHPIFSYTAVHLLQMASDIPLFRPDVNDPAWTLLSQGAEARVWRQGGVVCKERFPKRYRHPTLDERLTKARCRMEARILQKCAKRMSSSNNQETKGVVAVPKVLRTENALIYMEFVEGEPVRKVIDQYLADGSSKSSGSEPLTTLAQQLGQALAHLHHQGMVHGDLTTSNMILRPTAPNSGGGTDEQQKKDLVLIDFGLAKHSTAAEEKAVDLYVLERAIASTHASLGPDFWETVLRVYGGEQTSGGKKQDTLARLEQVRQRGRKRECFG